MNLIAYATSIIKKYWPYVVFLILLFVLIFGLRP